MDQNLISQHLRLTKSSINRMNFLQKTYISECAVPTIAHASTKSNGKVASGSEITFTCNADNSEYTTTCVDGDVNVNKVKCSVSTKCNPPTVNKGTITPSDPIEKDEMFTLKCEAGYKPSVASIKCLDNGALSESNPTCEPERGKYLSFCRDDSYTGQFMIT